MSNPNDSASEGGAIFHFGCGSLLISAIIGYPLGMIITRTLWGYDAGPFGALLGGLPVLLVCGFVARQRQKARARGVALMRGRIGIPNALRDWTVWICALFVAAAMGAYGANFAIEIGEPASAGAFGLGSVGFIVGLVVGSIFHVLRKLQDRVAWICTLVGTAAMAFLGASFAAEIDEPVAAVVFVLGIIGLVIGFVLGMIIRLLRRLVAGQG